MSPLLWATLAIAGADPMILLDAGPVQQRSLSGMHTLDPAGCSDGRVRWIVSPKQAHRTDYPDPISGDSLAEGGVLAVDLAPGRYTVSVLLADQAWAFAPPVGREIGLTIDGNRRVMATVPSGDDFFASAWYTTNPRPTFVKGETGWHRQLVGNARWYTLSFDADHTPTQLSYFGGALHALAIAPEQHLARTEVELALIDARRGVWFDSYVNPQRTAPALPYAEPGPLVARPGRFSDDPAGFRLDAEGLERHAAPGERVNWMVQIEGGDGPLTWQLHGLDDVEVKVHEVVWLDQRWNNELAPRAAYLVPSDGSLTAGQGLTPLVALSLRVPDAAHGQHLAGEITLQRDGADARLPINIRVRELTLEPSPITVGTFADLRSPVGVVHGRDTEVGWSIFEQDVALLRERGVEELALRMTSPTPERPRFGSWTDPEDPAIFIEAVRRWRAAGGGTVHWVDPVFEIASTVFSTNAPEVLPQDPGPLFDSFVRAATAEPDVCLYIYDEGAVHRHPDLVARTRTLAQALQAHAGTELCLSGATPHRLEWGLSDALHRPFVTHNRTDGQLAIERIQRSGRPASLYLLPNDREHTGVVPWALGAEAVVHWHYNELRSDPFDEVHRSIPWTQTYLSTDGRTIYPSTRLEAVAEGITDLRYLATTQALVEELAPRRRRRIRAAVAEARTLLRVAQANQAHRQTGSHSRGLWEDRALDDLRHALGDVSERLATFSARQRHATRSSRRGTPLDRP